VELAAEIGLADDLVAPATTAASIWSRGRMRRLPSGQVMGVPADLGSLAESGLLTTAELARATCDRWLPRTPVEGDLAVGRYVRSRLGHAVVDRLVEPLLGGVYAGRADELSFDMTVPQLFAAARGERSLLQAAAQVRAASTGDGQVFASLPGGLARLADRLVAALRDRGVQVRTGETVRGLQRRGDGWTLVVGETRQARAVAADAVVLALPARPAARLLAEVVPAAAAELAAVGYASMAIVTLAYPHLAFPRVPRGSGFLVPAVDRRLVKAATFSSSKWGWYAGTTPGLVLVRLSIGRHGDEAELQRDDAELVAGAAADLAAATGVTGPAWDSRVTRWGGALPQYAVGHRAMVARVRAAVAGHPGLAVCGAAYDGVGIPACIGSARAAAVQVGRSRKRPRP
jgi:oxygen-dependent protoporphyrinogen oxidase